MMRSFILAAILLASLPAFAADKLMVMEPWCRPASANTACYGMLHNRGSHPVTLTGITSSAARHVEAHESLISDDGVASMRRITPLTIQLDEMVTFLPEGNHIMVMGLDASIAEGDILPLQLQYEDGETQSVVFPVHMPKIDE